MFRIYLLIAILLLLPICFFITLQLIYFFRYYFSLFSVTMNQISNRTNINDILILFTYYLKKQEWLTCILMIELYQELNDLSSNNLLGICYQKISYNNIAKYYYLKALYNDCNNIIILQNLAIIYKKLDEKQEFNNICNKIVSIDSSNKFVIKNANNLKIGNRDSRI